MNADADQFEKLWEQMCSFNTNLSGNSVEKDLTIKKLQEQLHEYRPVVLLQPLEVQTDLLVKGCHNIISELDHVLKKANKLNPGTENLEAILKSGSDFKEEDEVKMESCSVSDGSDNEKLSIVYQRLQREKTTNDIIHMPYAMGKSVTESKRSMSIHSVKKTSKIIQKKNRTKQQFLYCCEEDAICNREAHHSLHIEIPRLFLQGQRHHLFLGNKLCDATFADMVVKAKKEAFQESPKESKNRKQRRDTNWSTITNKPTAQETELAHLMRNILPGDGSEDEETWKAASVLESINNTTLDSYESHIEETPISYEPSTSKGHRSSTQRKNRRPTAKRRKPGPKRKNKDSSLAEYLETFTEGDSTIADAVTPVASSSMALPAVSSTTQYYGDTGPVTIIFPDNWTNGGPYELIDENGVSLNSSQILRNGKNDTILQVQDNSLNGNFGQPVLLPAGLDVPTLIQPQPVTQTPELQNTNLAYPVINIQIPNIPVASTGITTSCKSNDTQQLPLPAHTKPPSSPTTILDLTLKSKSSEDDVATDEYEPLDLSARTFEPELSSTKSITANEFDASLIQPPDCQEDNDLYYEFANSLNELNFDRCTDVQYKGRDMPLLNSRNDDRDAFIGDTTKSLPVDSNFVLMNNENANLESLGPSDHSAKDIFNKLFYNGSFATENECNKNQDNYSLLDLDIENFGGTEIPISTFNDPDLNGEKTGDQNVTNNQRQDSKEVNKDMHLSLYSNIEEINFNFVEKCDSMTLNKENFEQVQQRLDLTENNKIPDETCANLSSVLPEATCKMPEINNNFGTKNMDGTKESDNTFEKQNKIIDLSDDDKNESQKLSEINLFSKSDHAVEKDAAISSNNFNIIQYFKETNWCNVSNNLKVVESKEVHIVTQSNVPTPSIELANTQQIVENCDSKNKSTSNEGNIKLKKLKRKTSENSRRQSLKNFISSKRQKKLKKTGTEKKQSSQIYKKENSRRQSLKTCISSKRQKQWKENGTEKKTTWAIYEKDKTLTKEKQDCNFNETGDFSNTNDSKNDVPPPSPSSTKIVFSVKRVKLGDEPISLDTSSESYEKTRTAKARAEISNTHESLNNNMQTSKDIMNSVVPSDDNTLESSHKKNEETQSHIGKVIFTKKPEITKSTEGNNEKGNEKNVSISQSPAVNTSEKNLSKLSFWQIESNIDDELDFEEDFDDALSLTASDIGSPIDNFTESLDCSTNDENVLLPVDSVTTESNADVFSPVSSVPANSSAVVKPAAESSLDDLKHFKIPKLNQFHAAKFNNNKKEISKSYEGIEDINDLKLQPNVMLHRIPIKKDGNYNVTKELRDGLQKVNKSNFNISLGKNEITSKIKKENNQNNATKTIGDKLSFKPLTLKSAPEQIPIVECIMNSEISNKFKLQSSTPQCSNDGRINVENILDITKTNDEQLSLKPLSLKSKPEPNQFVRLVINSDVPDKFKLQSSAPQCPNNGRIDVENILDITKTNDEKLSLKPLNLKSNPEPNQLVRPVINSNLLDTFTLQSPAPQWSNDVRINIENILDITKTNEEKLSLNPIPLKSAPKQMPTVNSIINRNVSDIFELQASAPLCSNDGRINMENIFDITKANDGKLNLNPLNLKSKPEPNPFVRPVINSNVSDKFKLQSPASQWSNDGSINIKNIFGITCLPYLADCCSVQHCQYSHELNDNETVLTSLQTLNISYLMDAYRFMYNHKKLFESFFLTFCNIFTMRKDRFILLNMAVDCERYPQHSQFLDAVYEGLVKCGFTRKDACSHILKNAKNSSHEFIDAQVAIIIKSDWTQFIDYIDNVVNTHNFRFEDVEKMSSIALDSNNKYVRMVFGKCIAMLRKDHIFQLASHSNAMEWVKLLQETNAAGC